MSDWECSGCGLIQSANGHGRHKPDCPKVAETRDFFRKVVSSPPAGPQEPEGPWHCELQESTGQWWVVDDTGRLNRGPFPSDGIHAKAACDVWNQLHRGPSVPSGEPPSEEARVNAEKDVAYAERNQVVLALARVAQAHGYKVGWLDETNDLGWRILYIDSDAGQLSWHFPVEDLPEHLFSRYDREWDGHTTPDKYATRLPQVRFPAVDGVTGRLIGWAGRLDEPCPAGYERHMWITVRFEGEPSEKRCAHCHTRPPKKRAVDGVLSSKTKEER